MKLPQFTIKQLLAWTAWFALLLSMFFRIEFNLQVGYNMPLVSKKYFNFYLGLYLNEVKILHASKSPEDREV